jgi:hypothetical protein
LPIGSVYHTDVTLVTGRPHLAVSSYPGAHFADDRWRPVGGALDTVMVYAKLYPGSSSRCRKATRGG